jgi:hypothetical protein
MRMNDDVMYVVAKVYSRSPDPGSSCVHKCVS